MNIMSALVRSVLEKHDAYEWTVQGFGFIRTKLADVGRIHVWDSSLAAPKVSTMHAHPWPLKSSIISGELINQRFEENPDGRLRYMRQAIKTGEGGGLTGEPKEVLLVAAPPETYWAGCVYHQQPQELHRSIPQDGTVTLLERPLGPPLQETVVLWPAGTQWVSAEPQPLDKWRVQCVIDYALSRWDAA